MPIFRASAFKWQCDKCGVFFKAGKGGACPSCKQALCDTHLYGSFFEKMKSRFSSERAVCVDCKAGGKIN